jgi:hypothetical protein
VVLQSVTPANALPKEGAQALPHAAVGPKDGIKAVYRRRTRAEISNPYGTMADADDEYPANADPRSRLVSRVDPHDAHQAMIHRE